MTYISMDQSKFKHHGVSTPIPKTSHGVHRGGVHVVASNEYISVIHVLWSIFHKEYKFLVYIKIF